MKLAAQQFFSVAFSAQTIARRVDRCESLFKCIVNKKAALVRDLVVTALKKKKKKRILSQDFIAVIILFSWFFF